MSKPYTKKELGLFEKIGREWELILGLQDWDIDYRLARKDDGGGFVSRVYMLRDAMNATLVLGEEDDPPSVLPIEEYLDESVLHELFHLTLWPLRALGEERFGVTEADMTYEEHRIIQRLVKLLMGAR